MVVEQPWATRFEGTDIVLNQVAFRPFAGVQKRGDFGNVYSKRSESEYEGKRICITGKVTEYKGAPEIVATDLQQI
jgi:DNA/RNA endonuclease YhcR with UshA esterase domain